jgi:glyoxylate reductase
MNQPRVFLTRVLPPAVMDRLAATTELAFNPENRGLTPAELIAGTRGRDAVLTTLLDRVDGAFLDACPGLKVVANFGVGYNHIDVAAATARRIPVTNTPGVLTEATADIAFGLLLATARRFTEGERLVRDRKWASWEPMQLLGQDLAGATLGLVGFGRIAQAVARRARGFDMKVVYWNRTRLAAVEEEKLGVEYRERDVLYAASDFVSVHVAYTPETHHLINAAALARMKPSAIFVNTARGSVVDEAALVHALKNHTIAAAGLDVYEDEPALHPGLYEMPHCTLLPHLGSATTGTRTKMGMLAVDNLLAVCAGQRPPNCVNPEILR